MISKPLTQHTHTHRSNTGTVTMEKHPHRGGGELQAAIHPCRHAAVMKNIIGHLVEGGKIPVVDPFVYFSEIHSVGCTDNQL